MDFSLAILNIILLLLQGLILLRAIRILWRDILDFGAVFELLYIVWFVPVIYDMLNGQKLFSYVYEMHTRYDISCTDETISFYNLISTLLILCFELGYSRKRRNKRATSTVRVSGTFSLDRYILIQAILFVFFLLQELPLVLQYRGNLVRMFLSAENTQGSVYARLFHMLISLLMLSNFLIKQRFRGKPVFPGAFCYGSLAVVNVFQSNQRRNIITVLLFVVIAVLLFSGKTPQPKQNWKSDAKRIRRWIVVLFLVCIVAVPILWKLRIFVAVYIRKGRVTGIHTRSFFQVLFGSGATGFPTMIAIRNFCEQNQTSFFFKNILFLLESWIPRSIFPGKEMVLTEYMQTVSGQSYNLSLFFIPDVYFTFSLLSPFVSYCVGAMLGKLYAAYGSSGRLHDIVYRCLFFSNIVLLFKNGLTNFIIILTYEMILFGIDLLAVNPNGGLVQYHNGIVTFLRRRKIHEEDNTGDR